MSGPVTSEERRRRLLVVTKRRATALLGGVTVVFAVVTVFGGHSSWAGYVQATAEASMVGGLADWFAVTALFRRPLGLPIPHTAIVAERKDQFGATLGEFIQESFLTPAAIVERVRAADVVSRVADWMVQPVNAARLASQVADAVAAFTDVLDDDEMRDTIADVLRQRVDALAVAPLAGRTLRYLTDGGRHDAVLDAALRGLDQYLDAHRDDLRRRLGDRSPWWLPGAVEDRMFERLIDGARAVLHDMVEDHGHQLRRAVDEALRQLASDLETSPAMAARADQLKKEVLGQPEVREWATRVWAEAKVQLRRQGQDPESELRSRLAGAIIGGGQRLHHDAALRATCQAGVEAAAAYVTGHFAGEITDLVSATIARWDSAETSRRLELLLGPDLQYIRINGTVVGGAAGLVLYSIAQILR